MKNQEEFYVVIILKGGKRIKLEGESTVSTSLLDRYSNAIKAELYQRTESREVKFLDSVSN